MMKRALAVVGVLFFAACADDSTTSEPTGSTLGDDGAVYEDGEGSVVEVTKLGDSDRFEVRHITADGEVLYGVFDREDRAGAAEFLSELQKPVLQVAQQLGGTEMPSDANLWVLTVLDPI